MFSRVVCILLFGLLFVGSAVAQWQKISTPAIENNPRSQVLTYKAGKLWYATQDTLWMTSDDGASWHVRLPEDSIASIHTVDFFDANYGVLATKKSTYLTTDGGLTWDTLYVQSDNCYALRFGRSPKEIAIGSNGLCHLMITTDGGLTWDSTDFKKDPTDKPWDSVQYDFEELKDVRILPSGTIKILLLRKGKGGSVIATTHDFGQSWKFSAGFDYDCFSFVIDECDTNLMYVVNEDALEPFDRTAMLYRTFDAGKLWQAPLTTPNLKYFTGCISLSPAGVVYVQTASEGIIRSTNNGTFWVKIAGPSGIVDTRLMAAVTDDLVYAADNKGAIWMTANAGGFPGGNTSRTRLGLSKSMLFAGKTAFICGDTLLDTLVVSYPECPVITLDGVFLEGNMPDYSILWRSGDTIVVRFIPGAIGKRYAELVLLLNGITKQPVPLLGAGVIPPFDIASTVPVLFDKDSVLFCDTVIRGLRLHTDGCFVPDIATQLIGGAAVTEYKLLTPLPKVLTGDDSITIAFTPRSTGRRQASCTIRFVNNTIYTIPLAGFGVDPGPGLTMTKAALFEEDSVALCTSRRDTFVVRSNVCMTRYLARQQIIGPCRDEYRIEQVMPSTLSGQDTIVVVFAPIASGLRGAEFHVVTTDSSRLMIPLSGYGVESPYALSTSTPSLFSGDIVSLCDAIEKTFVIHSAGCVVPDVAYESMSGVTDYTLLTKLPSQLTGADTVRISFTPAATGLRNGQYEFRLSDGKAVVIPLEGVGGAAPYTLAITPMSLFETDSLFSCETIERTIRISKSGCATVNVLSATCTGNASSDYSTDILLQDSLKDESIVTIKFQPTASGIRDAVYTIRFHTGEVITIPLLGYGKPTMPLGLATKPEFIVDTIGIEISVPITILGLDKQRSVTLDLSFDQVNLVYQGSRSVSGVSFDVPGSTTSTSSKLRIPASEVRLNDVSGYAHFSVYADSAVRSQVSIGKLVVLDSLAPCYYLTQAFAASSVTGPAGCEIREISTFLRYGKKPAFRIYPNPSAGKITIIPESLVYADITIVDAMGSVRETHQLALSKAVPASLDLSSLPSGLYFMRIRGDIFQTMLPVALEK